MSQSSIKISDGYYINRFASVFITNPPSDEPGLVVRTIPSGTQTIDGYVTANIGDTNGLALESTLSHRFGVVTLGTPQLVNVIGPTTLYTPTSGRRIRLKWLALATPDTNTATVIATVNLSNKDIYIWPLGAPGAFMHSSVREGEIDGILKITLSASAQDVYVNLDIEEF